MKKVILSIGLLVAMTATGQHENPNFKRWVDCIESSDASDNECMYCDYKHGKNTMKNRCTTRTEKDVQCKSKALAGSSKCTAHTDKTPRCVGYNCKLIVPAEGSKCHHHAQPGPPKADNSAVFHEPTTKK